MIHYIKRWFIETCSTRFLMFTFYLIFSTSNHSSTFQPPRNGGRLSHIQWFIDFFVNTNLFRYLIKYCLKITSRIFYNLPNNYSNNSAISSNTECTLPHFTHWHQSTSRNVASHIKCAFPIGIFSSHSPLCDFKSRSK